MPDPAERPAGLVAMFVAAGQGGRTVTSCDDGKTWIANHSYADVDEDHSPYTNKGLTYGNGLFAVVLGWGASPSVKSSRDGVNWTRDTSIQGGFMGGIAFGGDRLILLRQDVTQHSTDLGKTWVRSKVQPRNDYREGGGGHGLPGRKGVFGGGGGGTPSMSWDGGETFKSADGCPSMQFGGIGSVGGVAAGGGHLVFVSENGDFCHVTDDGSRIERGNVGGPVRGKVVYAGKKFWAVSGNVIYSSVAGDKWTKHTLAPTTVSLQSMAIGDTGTFVGVGRREFFRSTDGTNWQKVPGPTGPSLIRVVSGYGTPTANCPAP